MSDELRSKINWSCKFNNRPYQIIEGHLRKLEHTNLAMLSHIKVIIDTLYLFFNEQKHFYIKNLKKKSLLLIYQNT